MRTHSQPAAAVPSTASVAPAALIAPAQLIAFAFAFAFALALALTATACADALVAVGLGDGDAIPGDARRFDPVAQAKAFRARAGEGFQLRRISAFGVRPDGTVDMQEQRFKPEVTYDLVAASHPPANQPPIGAGGSTSKYWHRTTRIHVERPGYHETSSHGSQHKGRVTRGVRTFPSAPHVGPADRVVPDPKCPLSQLWALALARGAPRDAVATIDYSVDGYTFSISGLDVRVRMDHECTAR